MHRYNGFPWETGGLEIRSTLKGVLAGHGKPVRQATAIRLADLRKLVDTCDDGSMGRRDRALLLGFAGAFRRSELVALEVTDVVPTPFGLRVRIRRSKTDQERQGAEIGIPRGQQNPATCPVRALEAWRATLKHRAGPLFRRISKAGTIGRDALVPDSVRFLLLGRAHMAGITVPTGDRLTAHGLRAGFVTEAYDKGVRDQDIMDHTRRCWVIRREGVAPPFSP